MFDIALILLFVVKDIARLKVKVNQSVCFPKPPACLLFVSFLKVQERTVDASAWFGSAEGFGTGLRVLTSICLRLVLVIPRSSVEPARQSRLHTHSSSCFSQYYCSRYPALLIFCNPVLIYTLFFTIAFCQSILQKMFIRNSNVFFLVTFLCLFGVFLLFFFFLYQYLLSFLLLEVVVVRVVKLDDEPKDEHYQNTKEKHYTLTFGRI